jgi:hypothetical protein
MLLCGILLLTPGANFPPTTAVVGTDGNERYQCMVKENLWKDVTTGVNNTGGAP